MNMEDTLHALADPNRRQLLEILLRGEQPVGVLAKRLPIAQSGVSRHLRILREAGLVRARRDGQRRVYSVRPEPLRELSGWLERYRVLWEQRLDTFEDVLAQRLAEQAQETPPFGDRDE